LARWRLSFGLEPACWVFRCAIRAPTPTEIELIVKTQPGIQIPIIAVTSYALSGEEQKARAAGCDEYVPKPYSPRQLLEKIRQYLP
jgi:CheY-like chemotaxis protein